MPERGDVKYTTKEHSYEEAKSMLKALQREKEDYQRVLDLLLFPSAGTSVFVKELSNLHYNTIIRNLEDTVDNMKEGDILVVETKWTYITQGKNKTGWVPSTNPSFSIKRK